MNKKLAFIGILLVSAGFLFILTPAKNAIAGNCQVQINFDAKPNPVAQNGTLTFSGYVSLEGSAWEPPGTTHAGYCIVGSYPLKEVKISIQSSKFPGALATKLVTVKPSNAGPYNYSATLSPSGVNLKSGDSFDVYAVALGYDGSIYQQLTKSSTINVNVKASAYAGYGCVADNGIWACDSKNDKNCSNTIDPKTGKNVCQGKPCVVVPDTDLCNKAGATHKGCVGNICLDVAGSGSDECQVVGSACTGGGGGGGGPTTSPYTFNLPNPIGVTNFQDLINIIGKWIFNLAIPIAVIIIIYAGVIMLTSGGNPGRFQKGTKALWYAVIGLAIVLIGKGFVTLIQSILSLRNK